MIYLGIDFGTKRIGLAKAEGEIRMAIPLRTVTNDEELRNTLRNLVKEEHIEEIVVGIPVSFDGREHEMAAASRAFGEEIKELGLPVHFQNEVLTSAQAQREGGGDLDSSAAALILQSFLDRQRG